MSLRGAPTILMTGTGKVNLTPKFFESAPLVRNRNMDLIYVKS